MKMFAAPFDVVLMRYYLMMVVAVVPFFLGIPLLSLLALPMFFLAFMGVSFKKDTVETNIASKEINETFTPEYKSAA